MSVRGGRRARVRIALATAGVLVGSVGPAHAQPAAADGGLIVEHYRFGRGFGVESLLQLSAPLVVESRVGGRALLTVATGWTRTEMERADGEVTTLTGVVDTEVRLAVTPGSEHLRVFALGSIPTGMSALVPDEGAVLGPLSHDLLGFATPTLGSGGAVGVGAAGAAAVGTAAVGWAAQLRFPFSYQPVLGSPDAVRAGNELRLRVGVEMAVGRRSSLRAAGVASVRGRDRLRDRTVHGVGHRVAGHVAFDTPVGGTVATLWGSGFHRAGPALEPTAVGASLVPRGSLVAGGLRVRMGVGAKSWLEPEIEVRSSAVAPDAAGAGLESEGRMVRLGARLVRPLTGRVTMAAEAGGRWGTLYEGVHSVSTRGWQAALALHWGR